MECPNCAFQNTPGTPACVRCASRLDFSGVDVIPLRAPRGAVARRLSRGLGVVGFEARDVGRRIGGDLKAPRWLDRSWEGVSPGELLLCVVPGLAQIRRGHRTLGRSLMGVWLVLLLLALLNIGSYLCSLALLGAITLHCTAVGLLFAGVFETMRISRRLLVGLMVYLLVVGFIYYPAYWGLSRLFRIVPVAAQVRSGVVRTGDVLVALGPAFGAAEPERGDVVLYNSPSIVRPDVLITGGARVDRVLGVPGDRVEVRSQTVYVNGAPIPERMFPLGGLEGCPDIDVLAGPGQYIILPTLVRFDEGGAEYARYRDMVLMTRCIVNADSIDAVLTFRIRPWLRAGRLGVDHVARAPGESPP